MSSLFTNPYLNNAVAFVIGTVFLIGIGYFTAAPRNDDDDDEQLPRMSRARKKTKPQRSEVEDELRENMDSFEDMDNYRRPPSTSLSSASPVTPAPPGFTWYLEHPSFFCGILVPDKWEILPHSSEQGELIMMKQSVSTQSIEAVFKLVCFPRQKKSFALSFKDSLTEKFAQSQKVLQPWKSEKSIPELDCYSIIYEDFTQYPIVCYTRLLINNKTGTVYLLSLESMKQKYQSNIDIFKIVLENLVLNLAF